MLKKTIEYETYNGDKVVEDFYFNLTKSELITMELGTNGGLSGMVQRVIDAKDVPTMVKLFQNLILKSYGKKSDDGKRFMKSPDIAREFEESPAYDKLFVELATNDKAAADFVKALVPAEALSDVKQ